jgi:hypothetical protein
MSASERMVGHDMLPASPSCGGRAPLAVQKLLERATFVAAICSSMRLASAIEAALRAAFVA